jgi:hypothetical protein
MAEIFFHISTKRFFQSCAWSLGVMHAGSTAGVHEQTASLLRRHGMWSRLAAGAFRL